ncbi:hypothetical protein [Streptomyces sp. RKAG293]|uniref:hypothetical protein n=1 Tax=Streptomyces sp. RKAG293 TaxID=2893403 RepID=UPI0020346D5B|nr:hypothetical protein [Streptomyces sp. RKAG293]MCM2418512.1 hypothetical protein [Streptomyces sp. RKAG293]
MTEAVRHPALEHGAQLCGLAENEALPQHLLARFIDRADEELLCELAQRTDLGPALRQALVERGGSAVRETLVWAGSLLLEEVPRDDPKVALAALVSGLAPISWAADLAICPDRDIRWEVADLERDLGETFYVLANDPDHGVLQSLAGNAALPSDLMEALARHPSTAVRSALARNDQVPARILAGLLADGGSPPPTMCGSCHTVEDPAGRRAQCGDHAPGIREVQLSALQNPATPPDGLAAFVSLPDPGHRACIAERSGIADEVYTALADDADPYVRRTLAANPEVPEQLLRRLAGDSSSVVLRELGTNPAIPLDVLISLAAHQRFGREILPRIAAASEDELRLLAASPIAQVRALAAVREDLPADLLAGFVTDPDAGVAKRVAPHPSLTAGHLHAIAERHGPPVYSAVAANPHCSAGLLHRMALDSRAVRKALRSIARHPSATAETLLICLEHSDGRRYAVQHPAMPPALLVELLADPDWDLASGAAENSALPTAVMERLLDGWLPGVPEAG